MAGLGEIINFPALSLTEFTWLYCGGVFSGGVFVAWGSWMVSISATDTRGSRPTPHQTSKEVLSNTPCNLGTTENLKPLIKF